MDLMIRGGGKVTPPTDTGTRGPIRLTLSSTPVEVGGHSGQDEHRIAQLGGLLTWLRGEEASADAAITALLHFG
jgi:hypothetical protein